MRHFKLFLAIFIFFTTLLSAKVITLSVTHPDPRYGVFSTYYLKVEPLNDKTNRVRLLEDLIFIDTKGKKQLKGQVNAITSKEKTSHTLKVYATNKCELCYLF